MPNQLLSRKSRLRRLLPALAAVAAVLALPAPTPAGAAEQPPGELLIRCDDVGMCHAVNLAVGRLIASGVPFSASVMFACPWYLEAAAILKQHPEVGVGVHLTLNSEWERYKWGPVLGRSRVPSLVDANGHFFPTEEAFAARGVDLAAVEAELRAQIERAKSTGLRIDYLDVHMQTAYSTPELRALVESLARDYRLGIATYFGERSGSMWSVPPDDKLSALLGFVRDGSRGLKLLVAHLGLDNDEMTALVDVNWPADPFRVGRHRQAELDAVASPALRAAVAAAGLELITYRQLIERRGLESMKRPAQESGYEVELTGTK
jgi:predicted glycoside hydrolase/deacetylase ChbG (UPF0249 family)